MTRPVVPPPGDIPVVPGLDPEDDASSPTMRIIIFGVLIAIFGGVAAFVVVKVLNPPAPRYTAGDCVRVVEGGRFDAELEEVACTEPGALYEVGLYLHDPDAACPSDAYAEYRQAGGRQQEYKLCLVLNAAEGDCLRVPVIAGGGEEKVACTSDDADVRITKVVEGTADANACGADGDARVYPRPQRTVCLGPVRA